MRPSTIIILCAIQSAAWFFVGIHFQIWRAERRIKSFINHQDAVQKLQTDGGIVLKPGESAQFKIQIGPPHGGGAPPAVGKDEFPSEID
jgi:hypothetical protein